MPDIHWAGMVRRLDAAAEVRRLRAEGIPVGPSDAQQMILEMIPDARWEVTRVIEEIDIRDMGPNTIRIESQVTVVRVTDEGRDITIDVLNKETKTEQIHDHPRAPAYKIAGHQHT